MLLDWQLNVSGRYPESKDESHEGKKEFSLI